MVKGVAGAVADPLLDEITRRLVHTYRPERIYLFGSRARGDVGPALRRSAQAYEALWGLPASGDILVWSHTAFAERLHLRAALPSTVEREGRLLYSR